MTGMKQPRAKWHRSFVFGGWINWHMNRRRLPHASMNPRVNSAAEMRKYMRQISWRRIH
jgi:hypothetical protein